MNKISKRTLVTIITLILIIGSLVTLYLNHGFYYAAFHNQVRLSLSSTTENTSNIINKISSENKNIARIDREGNSIYFEYTNIDDIENVAVEAIGDKKVSFDVEKLISNDHPIREFAIVGLSILISSAAAIFYFLLKNNKGISDLNIIKSILVFAAAGLVSNLIVFGIISIASRFYQVKIIDLYSIVALNIWLAMLFLFGIWKFRYSELKEIGSLDEEIIQTLRNQQYTYLKIALLVLVVVSIGLGTSFVMTSIFLILSFVIAEFSLISVIVMNYTKLDDVKEAFRKTKRSLNNLKKSRSKKLEQKTDVQESILEKSNSEKKKTKKKKKSEKKGTKKRK